MPQMEKSKLAAFAKKKANPPPAATVLAQKRAQAKQPAPAPGAHPPAPVPGAEPPGDETEMHLHELVEEAAQEAESSADMELEDVVASGQSTGPDDPPTWATDPAKWKEAAEAVGLGGAGDDMFDEPYVVTAYLYKKIGGPLAGDVNDIPPPPDVPAEDHSTGDMSKPGAAAKALHARAAAKQPPAAGAPTAGAGAKPAAPGAKPTTPQPPPKPAARPEGTAKPGEEPPKKPVPGAKPGAPAPAAGAPPAGAGGGDELKALTDEAAAEAANTPDPTITEKLQAEPPQEGQAPSWALDQDKWTQAEQAVMANREAYPEPWIVVAHVYKKMGGQFA